MNYTVNYKEAIAQRLRIENERISLYWKGRVGLYALLKAMKISTGDEVIIPSFTCVVVPNAIIYCGAQPIYVDVSEKTLNTTAELIEQKITSRTKCIIIQNTFGLSSEVEEIVALAKKQNIRTIEDCTHGFGGTYNGLPNGSYCDAAFYSTQWNKPFSTGIGGFTLLNDTSLLPELESVNKDLQTPSGKQQKVLGMLIRVKKFMLHDSTYWPLLRLYRSWSKSGAVVGSSSESELISTKMPDDYFMGSTTVQQKVGINNIKAIEELVELRKKNGLIFNKFMRKAAKWNYPDAILDNHSFLKYPIFVKDREVFMKKAEKSKIRLGDWFLSPIHPVAKDFDKWKLTISEFPKSELYTQHIMNLPTDTKNTQNILRFLSDNLDEIITWEK